jgi:two-component system nitrate/nitrite response regulator NarL
MPSGTRQLCLGPGKVGQVQESILVTSPETATPIGLRLHMMKQIASAMDRSAPEISLLLAVESRMDGQLFKSVLERPRQRLKVISCAVSKAEFATSIASHTLDVALVSESLQDGPLTGFHVLKDLRDLMPRIRLIMLLKSEDDELVLDAFRAGAKGVFCRTECISLLPKCIRAVYNGDIWANSKQLHLVMESLVKSAAPLQLKTVSGRRLLTKREEDVTKLVVEGFSNREAAHKLGLTEHTVSNYLFKIYEKLGISRRVELMLYFLKNER